MEEDVATEHFSPPTTRDVLGAHLHQKVSETLSAHLIDAKKTVSDGCVLADKITGMLLERSLKDIHMMLRDDTLLLKNINMALDVLHEEYPDLSQTSAIDRLSQSYRQEFSLDEIGEVLFEKVCDIEESLAPQITGMLMELDFQTLLHFIKSDGPLFESAVKKAKGVLSSVTSLTECPPSPHSLSPPELTLKDDCSHSQGEIERKNARECLGERLYEHVMGIHPECASSLTGMILELELPVVELLLQDKQQLETAIAKAYTEWMKSTPDSPTDLTSQMSIQNLHSMDQVRLTTTQMSS
ncbi:hypothetical protein BsWGS_23100 [Bradybaena similaris]